MLLVLPLIITALPSSMADNVRRFLPANIGDSITSLHHGANSFAPWSGFALMCGYAAVALIIGGVLFSTRDA